MKSDIENLLTPMIPFNHMKYATVSYKGGQLKISIDYEKGNHYNYKRQLGGL